MSGASDTDEAESSGGELEQRSAARQTAQIWSRAPLATVAPGSSNQHAMSKTTSQAASTNNIDTPEMSDKARGKQRVTDDINQRRRRGPSASSKSPKRISLHAAMHTDDQSDRSSEDELSLPSSQQRQTLDKHAAKRKRVIPPSPSSSARSASASSSSDESVQIQPVSPLVKIPSGRRPKQNGLNRVPHAFKLEIPLRRSVSVKSELVTERQTPYRETSAIAIKSEESMDLDESISGAKPNVEDTRKRPHTNSWASLREENEAESMTESNATSFEEQKRHIRASAQDETRSGPSASMVVIDDGAAQSCRASASKSSDDAKQSEVDASSREETDARTDPMSDTRHESLPTGDGPESSDKGELIVENIRGAESRHERGAKTTFSVASSGESKEENESKATSRKESLNVAGYRAAPAGPLERSAAEQPLRPAANSSSSSSSNSGGPADGLNGRSGSSSRASSEEVLRALTPGLKRKRVVSDSSSIGKEGPQFPRSWPLDRVEKEPEDARNCSPARPVVETPASPRVSNVASAMAKALSVGVADEYMLEAHVERIDDAGNASRPSPACDPPAQLDRKVAGAESPTDARAFSATSPPSHGRAQRDPVVEIKAPATSRPAQETKTTHSVDTARMAALDAHIERIMARSRAATPTRHTPALERALPDSVSQSWAPSRPASDAAVLSANSEGHVPTALANGTTASAYADLAPGSAEARQMLLDAHIDRIMARRREQLAGLPANSQLDRAPSRATTPRARDALKKSVVLIELGQAKPARPDAVKIPAPFSILVQNKPIPQPRRTLHCRHKDGAPILFDRRPPKPPALTVHRVLNDDYEPARLIGGWVRSASSDVVRTDNRTPDTSDDEVRSNEPALWSWSIAKAIEAAKSAGDALRRTNRVFTQSRLPCDVASATADEHGATVGQQRKRRRRRKTMRQILEEQYRFLRRADSSDESDGEGGPLAMVESAISFSFDERLGDETICQDLASLPSDDDRDDSDGGNPHEFGKGGVCRIVNWQLEGLDRGRGRAWNGAVGVSRQGGKFGRPWAVADPNEFVPLRARAIIARGDGTGEEIDGSTVYTDTMETPSRTPSLEAGPSSNAARGKESSVSPRNPATMQSGVSDTTVEQRKVTVLSETRQVLTHPP
ncbi:hypothetical protein ACM66B_006273 [Microbotryomycetes sp. NB124-2]